MIKKQYYLITGTSVGPDDYEPLIYLYYKIDGCYEETSIYLSDGELTQNRFKFSEDEIIDLKTHLSFSLSRIIDKCKVDVNDDIYDYLLINGKAEVKDDQD